MRGGFHPFWAEEESPVHDVAYILISVALFVALAVIVRLVERL
ncbi:hypothetical protein [Asanoa sp. NPDC050611]